LEGNVMEWLNATLETCLALWDLLPTGLKILSPSLVVGMSPWLVEWAWKRWRRPQPLGELAQSLLRYLETEPATIGTVGLKYLQAGMVCVLFGEHREIRIREKSRDGEQIQKIDDLLSRWERRVIYRQARALFKSTQRELVRRITAALSLQKLSA
jgi:hypothetical protein